jgi:hypothetical protein
MITTRFQRGARILHASMAVAAVVVIPTAARPVDAAGIRNCVDVTGRAAPHVACYEAVWASGVQLRMTFSNTQFRGVTPSDTLDDFYVMAPQTDTAQGSLPFPHDHVVRDVPSHNHGAYSVQLHGFFVLCSEQGIVTGACEPTLSSIEGLGTLPLAKTVNGQPLTSVEPIEAAADAGLITLFDTGAVLIGTITAGK